MIKNFPFFAISLLLCSCAAQDPDQKFATTNMTLEQAVNKLNRCYADKINLIDDFLSDATTVAEALAYACQAEEREARAIYVDNSSMSFLVKNMIMQDPYNDDTATPLTFVLKNRRKGLRIIEPEKEKHELFNDCAYNYLQKTFDSNRSNPEYPIQIIQHCEDFYEARMLHGLDKSEPYYADYAKRIQTPIEKIKYGKGLIQAYEKSLSEEK